jgi:hypothetical protein
LYNAHAQHIRLGRACARYHGNSAAITPRALQPAALAGRHVHHRALTGIVNKNRWVGLTFRLRIEHVSFLTNCFHAAAPRCAGYECSATKTFQLPLGVHLTSEAI